jgi:hypothetical protein
MDLLPTEIEIYQAGVSSSLRLALEEFLKAQEHSDRRTIETWRRRVEDLTAVLEDIEWKKEHGYFSR